LAGIKAFRWKLFQESLANNSEIATTLGGAGCGIQRLLNKFPAIVGYSKKDPPALHFSSSQIS
jgi:hypothetical protein